MRTAKEQAVINPIQTIGSGQAATAFWAHLFADNALRQSHDLEKILAGCEIIAALDDPMILGG